MIDSPAAAVAPPHADHAAWARTPAASVEMLREASRSLKETRKLVNSIRRHVAMIVETIPPTNTDGCIGCDCCPHDCHLAH